MDAQSPDELLTPAGVAALLFVDPRTVTRWAAAGKLAAVRTPGGHRRYLRSEVLAMVSGVHSGFHDRDDRLDLALNAAPDTIPPPRRTGTPVGDADPERQAAAAAVVAEAVALALEAAAVEAAEAVLVTAAAVADAAERAASAAERARQARSVAAEAAARSVAEEAERTAEHVQQCAARAAERVRDAATLAADELARRLDGGVTLDPTELARLIAATVRAAADATELDTTRAATDVRRAGSAAAAKVALTHAAAQELAQRDAAAGAQARRELADATAVSVASDTDARAAGVALMAREAATALVGDGRGAPGVGGPLDARQSAFAAELSHDLRVSLTSIMANVELLEIELGHRAGASTGALLGRALRSGHRMARVLDRHMTPRVAGDASGLPEVDLADVVRQLLIDSADLLEPTGAVVETDDLPVVRADPDEIYTVMQNLLVNSVKFARPGVPGQIWIGARRTAGGWRITVRDNGVGMPEQSGLDVFSLYARGTRTVVGHGIGLATVARIVAEHGGRVGVTPAKVGAAVWFELPDDAGI